MRKRLLSFVLILGMGVLLFTGCGKSVGEKTEKPTPPEPKATYEESEAVPDVESETNTDPEADPDAALETDTDMEPEADTDGALSDAETSKDSKSADSPNITPVEASLEKPAKIGEWVEAKKRSTKDKDYHTVYFRITGIIAGDEAAEIVDEYNSENAFVTVSDLEKDDLEYRVVTYEAYFPEDFPQSDFGISDVSLNLNLCNLKDSGPIAGYIGLSTTWDISDKPDTFHAGETFKGGSAVFAMAKENPEYLFKYGYKEKEADSIQTFVYVEGQ